MTDKERKDLISDLNGIETVLCAIEGVGPQMTDKDAFRAVARAVWRIQTILVKEADNERRI